MHWILQSDIFSEQGWRSLVDTLERFGIPHSVHKVVPFVGELLPRPVLDHANVICIGSYSMRHVAAREDWRPGVFDIGHQDFEKQRQHWGEHMLNAASKVCSFSEAVFDREEMFVRPVNDAKYFAGRVISRAEFSDWQRKVCDLGESDGSSLTAQTAIQLAPPLRIHAEYRYWVVKGRIVTRSLYKRGDRVIYSGAVDARLDSYVEARLAQWLPHESFVIDVCDTPDGIKVVEINTLNAAGFYAADMQSLVMALEAGYDQGVAGTKLAG
jgi:hypothetical protein